MTAQIYCPAKSAMQSGKSKSSEWILEYQRQSAPRVESLMGYTSSSDMLTQIKLTFTSKEDAIAYAERNGISFHLREPKEAKRRKISYSDNFNFDRKVPWTH